MNILIPDSWLREFLDTDATPQQIQSALSLCGPSIERLIKFAPPLKLRGGERGGNTDWIYDIEITTNRVDCMSVIGFAREAVAILPQFKRRARLIKSPFATKPSLKTSTQVPYLEVKVDQTLCPRFTAVLIQNVTIGPSPDWLAKRLELVGMRPLNAIVDISNYLMHELGQPIHTFDYDKITNRRMTLRASRKGEKITTLDGKTHTLHGGDIVIEDGSGKLIDLCGIMGGLNSAVDTKTKNVLLFVQTYDPVRIRKTSMSLAHRTQAAVLFEKKLSPDSVLPTTQSAIQLFILLTHGQPSDKVLDIYTPGKTKDALTTSFSLPEFINSRLGINLSAPQISQFLAGLGFRVLSDRKVEIPWYRTGDISIPEDIVEEVARIYGYHNLPSQIMSGPLPTNRNDKVFYWEHRLKTLLVHLGFTEVYTWSLVEIDTGLKLKNPLTSEWSYLRTTLTPSHLKIHTENAGKADQFDFFEITSVYLPRRNDLPLEEPRLIISTNSGNYSKFKGIIETVLSEMGIADFPIRIQTHSNILVWETPLLPLISQATTTRTYTAISQYPPIMEDVNITHNRPYAEIIKSIQKISSLIKQIDLIDKFGDKLTLRLTFHSASKQLSSLDIIPIRDKIANIQL